MIVHSFQEWYICIVIIVGETSNDILRRGQVITLEPGLYVPGIGGARIEDDYLVLDDSVENLSPFPREVVSV